MAWIESHQSLTRHPKMLRLATRVRVCPAQAIGHLHFLSWRAVDYAPDGDLSRYAAQELAAACEWNGDPDLWLAALHESGWIDPDGRLHNWDSYGGRLCRKRENNRVRQERWRQRRRENAPPDDVTRGVTEDATVADLAISPIARSGPGSPPALGVVEFMIELNLRRLRHIK